MSEPRSLPAKYDPDRGDRGRFALGNKASVGWNSDLSKRFYECQQAWLEAITPEDMVAVAREHLWLTQQRDNMEVKIKAIALWQDRTLGKPRERIDVDLRTDRPAPVLDLTVEELTVLERLVQRTELPEAGEEG